jgi:hypothetical protein
LSPLLSDPKLTVDLTGRHIGNPHHKSKKKVNKFGLPRRIPDPIAREIRQRCGFGCVICGFAICAYEHTDPTYADAKEHEPNRITLLCGHCHDKVTRGQIYKATVWQHNANPFARRAGYSFDNFDLGDSHPTVVVGNLGVIAEKILVIGEETVIGIKPPEAQGGPFRLTATLYNDRGERMIAIKDNEWRVSSSNWDAHVTGQRITIRKADSDIGLILRVDPPKALIIER